MNGGSLTEGLRRHRRLGHSPRSRRPLSHRWGHAPALCRYFSGRRDQFHVSSAPPAGDLRTMGRVDPGQLQVPLKLPKAITHQRKLVEAGEPLEDFLTGARLLGKKLGPILVQLPPSLAFDPGLANSFFTTLRDRHAGPIVCEPRHASWFADDADALLKASTIGRVAADPAVVPAAAEPGGWREPAYYRLHGSPRKYFSAYEEESIRRLASVLEEAAGEVWCIFDNTASGAAAGDALNLLAASPS